MLFAHKTSQFRRCRTANEAYNLHLQYAQHTTQGKQRPTHYALSSMRLNMPIGASAVPPAGPAAAVREWGSWPWAWSQAGAEPPPRSPPPLHDEGRVSVSSAGRASSGSSRNSRRSSTSFAAPSRLSATRSRSSSTKCSSSSANSTCTSESVAARVARRPNIRTSTAARGSPAL